MRIAVAMPKLSGIESGDARIATWLKQPGQAVKRGDDLLEVETDKATVAIQANHTGTLLEIIHPEGDLVPGGEDIAVIEADQ